MDEHLTTNSETVTIILDEKFYEKTLTPDGKTQVRIFADEEHTHFLCAYIEETKQGKEIKLETKQGKKIKLEDYKFSFIVPESQFQVHVIHIQKVPSLFYQVEQLSCF